MEATGHYWLNLYTWLSDKSFRFHVINPLQSDALRNLYIRKTKTDSVDAKIIADVIRIGQYSETQLADKNIIALRDLNCQRFYLLSNVRNSACCRNSPFYSILNSLSSCDNSTTIFDLLSNPSGSLSFKIETIS